MTKPAGRSLRSCALTLDPENLIALRHLGDIACTNGANDQAREWYTRVLDADPRNDEIIALLASLEEQAKKDAIGAPIASVESMSAAANRGTEAFAAAGDYAARTRPFWRASVAEQTPIVPIESIDTPQIPAAAALSEQPPRETMGLMDLAIDFESTPAGSLSLLIHLPPADADLGAGYGVPAVWKKSALAFRSPSRRPMLRRSRWSRGIRPSSMPLQTSFRPRPFRRQRRPRSRSHLTMVSICCSEIHFPRNLRRRSSRRRWRSCISSRASRPRRSTSIGSCRQRVLTMSG